MTKDIIDRLRELFARAERLRQRRALIEHLARCRAAARATC